MKKVFVIGLTIAVLSTSGLAGVSGQEADTQFKKTVLTSTIDGIEVPQDVLEYAQITYDGHAVTKAEKITRDGQPLYRLRVDRDDIPDDYESILLLFDVQWKLLGTEKPTAPPPPPPEPQPVPEPPEPEPEKPERREGGQGGGDDDKPSDDKPPLDSGDDEEDESGGGDETGGGTDEGSGD